METTRVAQLLDEMGTMLELTGTNPFRCRAYHNAAQALKGMPEDLTDAIQDGSLKARPGIGDALYAKIVSLVTTGALPDYDALRQRIPPGLLALLRVPGLGTKKIQALHGELGIDSLVSLRAAAEAGRIAGLKGFGAKTQAKILEGIAFVEKVSERVLWSSADRIARAMLAGLCDIPGVKRAQICGSYRRGRDTVGDLDFLFSSEEPESVIAQFVTRGEVLAILAQGPTKASVRLFDGLQCDVRGVTDEQYAFALNYFTGSKEHNITLRRRAQARGMKLSEYALESSSGPVPCPDEAALYEALGLPYIPPELREDHGEFEAAEQEALPELIELDDLVGTFHCHTNWSDGGNTLEEMASAARAIGLSYLGIADHSRTAAYAGGLSIERVEAQWREIDRLNYQFPGGFRLLKGIECDILGDGRLDYPDEVLAGFDYVVASIHSSFGLSREEQTRRLVRAAEHPAVSMIGHLTGRVLLMRDGYSVDTDAVIAAAARSGAMIEINANPHRLDIDEWGARKACRAGVPLVINPDAHSVGGLADLRYGLNQARRGWLTRKDVFNTRTLTEVQETLRQRRSPTTE